jgi:hypothetical protein
MLEDAEARAARLERAVAFDATLRDDHHLARRDLALESGADDVERAGLRRQHPAIAQTAQHQRPHAQRSRTPISLVRVIATIENAPSTRRSASFIRSGMVRWIDRAIRWMMHSLSEEDWKIEPRSISSRRRLARW